MREAGSPSVGWLLADRARNLVYDLVTRRLPGRRADVAEVPAQRRAG